MSSSYCAVWAARMGDRAEALEALDKGMASRMHAPFGQFVEAVPATQGGLWQGSHVEPWLTKRTCFVTACGGFLTAALLGFSGLQLGPGDPVATWPAYPVALPAGWEAMEIERLWLRGQPARCVARHGADRAELHVAQE